MTGLRVRTLSDKAFAVGLALKGLDGLAEVVGGLWLLLLGPVRLQAWVGLLVAPELRQDPHDAIATHILHWAAQFDQGSVLFAVAYLLSHGAAKLVVIVEILRGRLWAYPGLIGLTAAFAAYQLYHMAVAGPSFGFVALTLFDLLIIALTVVEYRRLRHAAGESRAAG